MSGLTIVGGLHTVIGTIAVVAGFVALWKRGSITTQETYGKAYVLLTVITCVSGFFIFQHGGFGVPHALGILTLIVLLFAWLAERLAYRRPKSLLINFATQAAYSLTLFFHFVPGVTETLTRLPVESPIASSPEDPLVKGLVGICFLLFLVLISIQAVRLRKTLRGHVVVAAPTQLSN